VYSYGKLTKLRFSHILGHVFLHYCTHPKIKRWIQFTFQKGLSVNFRLRISGWTINDGISFWLQNRSVILSFPPVQHTHRSFFWFRCTTECRFTSNLLHSETKFVEPTSYVFSHVMKTLYAGAPGPLHCRCDTKWQVMSVMEADSREAHMYTGRNKAPARHTIPCNERNACKN